MGLMAEMTHLGAKTSSSQESRRTMLLRFGRLPLSWKLLLPSLGLIVVFGITGGFFVVRDLATRSQAAIDLELSQKSFEARALVRDSEASLIESANFASNLEGISAAMRRRDSAGASRVLQSVMALKPDLELLSAVDLERDAIVEFSRVTPGDPPALHEGRSWAEQSIVSSALVDPLGGKFADFISLDGDFLAIAAPVCTAADPCRAVGAVVVGIRIQRLSEEVLQRLGSGASLAFFDVSGRTIAQVGSFTPSWTTDVESGGSVRLTESTASGGVGTHYAPVEIRERKIGTIAVSIPVEQTLASVRRTGMGLGLILISAMAGIASFGFLLSRLILRQVRSLSETNRALGRGDLSARATVEWEDEIGELAARLNEMAEQLQASYETLELRVAQRTEEVERLLRERSEFFASVSHELRTPLAVILRHAEMLLDTDYGKNGRWRVETGAALKDSGGQLSRLIDDILDLAKAEAAQLDMEIERIDLHDVFTEVRRTIEPLARSAGLSASVHIPRSLPKVLADPRRLRQILLNLVDNAVKYTPEGGQIEVSARQLEDFVEIGVADTGVGMPVESDDRIFEPFFRVKGVTPQRGQSSSGLGLAVVRRLVEAHAGSVSYTSRPGEGTTFTFTIPVAKKGGLRSVIASEGHERARVG